MNDRVLVSAVGGDIGCSISKCLLNSGFEVWGCDALDSWAIKKFIRHFDVVPGAIQVEEYFRSINTILKQNDIAYYIPVSEPEINLIHLKRKEFEGLPVKVLINNSIIINNFSDKWNTVQFLEKLRIQVPDSCLLKDFREQWNYPFLIKARKGCGGKQVFLVEDENDLRWMLSKAKDGENYIAQKNVGSQGEEYTSGVFSDGHTVQSIHFHRKLGYGNLSKEVEICRFEFLDRLAENIAKAVDLKGCINIQTRKVGDIFVPFEINPRISSTVSFRKAFGFDDVVWWMNLLSGKGNDYGQIATEGRAARCLEEIYDVKSMINELN
jgi:carbamoyl-phosphate synthase large subunit